MSDTSTLDATVKELARDDQEWRIFLARSGIPAASASYERISQDPFGFVIEVARRLGIDLALLRRGYTEAQEPMRHEPVLPDTNEIASNFLNAM